MYSEIYKNNLYKEISSLITNYSKYCHMIMKQEYQNTTPHGEEMKDYRSSMLMEIQNMEKKYDLKNVDHFELVFGNDLPRKPFWSFSKK